VPEDWARDYPGFGCNRDNPLEIDLTEPIRLIECLYRDYGVALFNLSAGSPYYNPHMQRPAFYPPSDGYQPPEDPLVGCVRQVQAVRQIKQQLPQVPVVGTAYTYFQEYLPHVAQAVVRAGWVDSVGIGRLVLSDWELPANVLAGKDYRAAKKLCRTFSDCTTAPRNGLISGCYPLDEHYKELPEAERLKEVKAGMKRVAKWQSERTGAGYEPCANLSRSAGLAEGDGSGNECVSCCEDVSPRRNLWTDITV
jgi:hypothetical protein